MRLSGALNHIICKCIEDSFGDSKVYLFGSRVDDDKIGGDIDLAVENYDDRTDFRKKKAAFYASVYKMDCDIKIDLVQYNKGKDKLINREIEEHSLLLN